MTHCNVIVAVYCIGFLAMFFGLKLDKLLKEPTWEKVCIRLFFSFIWPPTILFIIGMPIFDFVYDKIKIDFSKPPKWL